jgi:hypothetical protein
MCSRNETEEKLLPLQTLSPVIRTVYDTDSSYNYAQGDSRGNVNILRGDSIGRCEIIGHMNMCLNLNG